MPKETLDGYLSRKIQKVHPTALVYKLEDGQSENWVVRREGEPDLSIGTWFGLAKQSILAMVSAANPKPRRERGNAVPKRNTRKVG